MTERQRESRFESSEFTRLGGDSSWNGSDAACRESGQKPTDGETKNLECKIKNVDGK